MLLCALLIANAVALPDSILSPHYWPITLAEFAPLALVAMASTPSIVTGGIDLSISPNLVFVNIVIVKVFLAHAWASGPLLLPLSLVVGLAVGLVMGLAIAVARVPAFLVTLCGLFILTGVDLRLLSQPLSASSGWWEHLAGSIGPIPGGLLTIGLPLIGWLLVARGPFGTALRAVGSSDGAALSAGINVTGVKLLAYGMGGLLAGVGALAYTALTQSADPTAAQEFTVLAIAAVALGGTVLSGGEGGLGRSVMGAGCIFLIQELLSASHIAASWLNVVYGGMLVVAIVLSAGPKLSPMRRSA